MVRVSLLVVLSIGFVGCVLANLFAITEKEREEQSPKNGAGPRS